MACRKTSTLDTKKNWWISPNTSGKNKPMKLRSDFNEALSKLHRLHRESGVIRRLLHPAHLGGSGTIPGGAHEKF